MFQLKWKVIPNQKVQFGIKISDLKKYKKSTERWVVWSDDRVSNPLPLDFFLTGSQIQEGRRGEEGSGGGKV
jgi:hypothetical protein